VAIDRDIGTDMPETIIGMNYRTILCIEILSIVSDRKGHNPSYSLRLSIYKVVNACLSSLLFHFYFFSNVLTF